MNRKNTRLFGLALLALMATAAQAQTPPAVQKITILPSRLNARIVLEAAVPLPALGAAYAAGETPQLLVEFGPAKWPEPPAVPADEPPLVKDIKVTTKSNGRSELRLTLTGKVPFRIFSEGGRNIYIETYCVSFFSKLFIPLVPPACSGKPNLPKRR